MKAIFGKSGKKIKSAVFFLPTIDLLPTDLTHLYSTLKDIEELTRKKQQGTGMYNDLPQWCKAMQVLLSPVNDFGYFIIQLGKVSTKMSFLGCIGCIIGNSGMGDALKLICAENKVPYLLSGKTVDRAIKGHQMADILLNTILLEDIMGSTYIDSDSIKHLLQEAAKGNLGFNNITYSEVLKMIQQKLNQQLSTFTSNHTAKLWMSHYLYLNDLLRQHLRSARLGNSKLHLEALYKIFP